MSLESNAGSEKRALRYAQSDKLQRKSFRRRALLPFTLVLAIALAYCITALALRSPVQVAVLSDSALTLLVLCPATICLFPLVIASLVFVVLMGRWQRASVSPLRRLEGWTATLEANAEKWFGRIDDQVLRAAVAFAPIRQLLRSFDTLASEQQDEGDQ